MSLDLSKLKDIGAASDMWLPTTDEGLLHLDVSAVSPDPDQPRKAFDAEGLARMAASIAMHGVIEPIVVRRQAAGEGYVIVTGERRWRASVLAQQATIPAILRAPGEGQGSEVIAIQLVENMHREDLSPWEMHSALVKLIQLTGWSQKRVGEAIGQSQAWVSCYLAITKMEPAFLEAIHDGRAANVWQLARLNTLHKEAPEFVEAFLDSGAAITRQRVDEVASKIENRLRTGDQDIRATHREIESTESPTRNTEAGSRVVADLKPERGGFETLEDSLAVTTDAAESGNQSTQRCQSDVLVAARRMAEDLVDRTDKLADVLHSRSEPLAQLSNDVRECADAALDSLRIVQAALVALA